jgi:hypothetical protein
LIFEQSPHWSEPITGKPILLVHRHVPALPIWKRQRNPTDMAVPRWWVDS